MQVSELSLLSRQVITEQEKQVSDLQERLCTVGSGLSSLQSGSGGKETTNRVASKLSVSHLLQYVIAEIQCFMQCIEVFLCCTTPLVKRSNSKLTKYKYFIIVMLEIIECF